ncbi:hypothetical protein REPUB_Repub05bG0037400 [Reevesia pubescens]
MEGDLDRISTLPEAILCQIMSFLSTKDAVCTSILSTRWRYLFAAMSTFDFDDSLLQRPQKNDGCLLVNAQNNAPKINNFMNFVDRLLFFPNKATVECFRLHFSSYVDSLRVYGWICAALWHGVKELDIRLGLGNSPILPTVLFTSKSLVTLKLEARFFITVPSNVFFPSLKTLELRYVNFVDGDSIQILFASSPMLEESFIFQCNLENTRELNISNPSLKRLTIDCISEVYYRRHNLLFEINVPSLVYFKYVDFIEEDYTITNMHSLVKADIRIALNLYEIYEDHHQRALAQLLQGICNVKSLYLTIDLDALRVLYHKRFLACYNLVKLEIIDNSWEPQGTSLSEFLEFLPNLETLVLRDLNYEDAVWSPPEKVPSCLLFHLKEIVFGEFHGGSRHLIEMIKYFLKNAIVLENLKICMNSLEEKEQLEITKELLRLPRISMKCQVVTF